MIGKRWRKIIQQLLLIFCILKKTKKCPVYISKINLNCEKQIILLIIPNEGKSLMALCCSKKIICIIKWNYFKMYGRFLLLEMSSFF